MYLLLPPSILRYCFGIVSNNALFFFFNMFVLIDLFYFQINKEEYEEALSLAKTYGMDADRVYQRQWRYTPVSSYSIQNYLVSMYCISL
jgi:hypothetical protein